MSTHHIAFLETEGEVLQRHIPGLRKVCPDWQIVLVADPDAALELLSQRPFCLVFASFGANVSDCENFLGEVQKRVPAVMRLAMVAEPHQDCLSPPVDFAHQCYAVQCTQADLRVAMQRAIAVWIRSRNSLELQGLLSRLRTVPTPPALYFKIRQELDAPDGDARSVARIVARDPALVARILKVVNSGFYAVPRSVIEIHEAITFLGADTVTSLVLATQVFHWMPLVGINMDGMWKHSLTVAALARQIAAEEGGDQLTVNAAGVAGLLHDLGELILLANLPDRYQSMIRRAAGDETALLGMEREQFGVGHPELGACVLTLWSLPDIVVDAVGMHHERSPDSQRQPALASKAVFAAEWLLQEFTFGAERGQGDDTQNMTLNFLPTQIERWQDSCAQLLEQSLA